ncbi:ubiquitin carboxyl-terminal hydrolase 37-like protein [Lates japonicus]|uniref:Ubiquitin carboxyl-terminal hydrolase 37-like protein n=1 Tax=Lates japonicus TaxID=270547 RepID=A0AAD3MK11_LATJO|nr:ubiquitin carboxyl-terminal hydrolase 37-like protein [Lates japonicus]
MTTSPTDRSIVAELENCKCKPEQEEATYRSVNMTLQQNLDGLLKQVFLQNPRWKRHLAVRGGVEKNPIYNQGLTLGKKSWHRRHHLGREKEEEEEVIKKDDEDVSRNPSSQRRKPREVRTTRHLRDQLRERGEPKLRRKVGLGSNLRKDHLECLGQKFQPSTICYLNSSLQSLLTLEDFKRHRAPGADHFIREHHSSDAHLETHLLATFKKVVVCGSQSSGTQQKDASICLLTSVLEQMRYWGPQAAGAAYNFSQHHQPYWRTTRSGRADPDVGQVEVTDRAGSLYNDAVVTTTSGVSVCDRAEIPHPVSTRQPGGLDDRSTQGHWTEKRTDEDRPGAGWTRERTNHAGRDWSWRTRQSPQGRGSPESQVPKASEGVFLAIVA